MESNGFAEGMEQEELGGPLEVKPTSTKTPGKV